MKTLGLIGGTTWVSTLDYYRYINELTSQRLGGDHSARLLLYSLNFQDIRPLAEADDWEAVGRIVTDAARRLEAAGAEALVLCANTMHLVAGTVEENVSIPILHIVDATAEEIARRNIDRVALLGTRFTMEKDFYKSRLAAHGIASLVPERDQREFIHESIFSELGKNIFKPETKKRYLEITDSLRARGAEGVIFGCTEIPLLLKPEDFDVPSFDTTLIHAKSAVDFALSD